MALPPDLDPDRVVARMFSSANVTRRQVFHRSVRDVERLIGRDRFLRETRKRAFRTYENNGQFIVVCNDAPIRQLL